MIHLRITIELRLRNFSHFSKINHEKSTNRHNCIARNTAVILKKAVKMPGATHIAYTKGEAGYATTRAQVLSCPNPNLKTKDPETMAYQREYLEHD